MSFLKPQTVGKSLWPSLSIIWSFGFANFRAKRGWKIFYAIIMTAIIVYVNIYALTIKNSPMKSLLRYIVSITPYYRIPAGLVTIWLWVAKGANAVENGITELANLDEELRNFGAKINHKKFMVRQLITIGGFMALLLSVHVMLQSSLIETYDLEILDDSYSHLLLTISIHMQNFQAVVADLVFVMMLEAFFIRFKLVNEIFKRIADSEDIMKVKAFATSYSRVVDISDKEFPECQMISYLSSHLVMERVDRACRIQRRLLKAVQDIADAFSLHFCVYYPIFFVHIVMESLLLVSILFDKPGEGDVPTNASAITAIFTTIRFWQIVVSCSKTSDEANKFGVSLYRVPINDVAVHNQLREHSVHMIHRKLRFTAGGIFVIDRNLAKSIFSVVIKYMIVIIQIRKSEKQWGRV